MSSPREVIARHRWVPPGEYAPNEEDYAAADAVIAALSAAGMTICGEQVSFDTRSMCYRYRDGGLCTPHDGVFVPVLSDPQEGDK